jgi:hypothetical protein
VAAKWATAQDLAPVLVCIGIAFSPHIVVRPTIMKKELRNFSIKAYEE